MKSFFTPLLLIVALLLSACTPHPASGFWKTTQDNVYGITKLVIGFDGRAEFVTNKQDNATWRCFWSAIDERQARLKCTSSKNPEQDEDFILTINNQSQAELKHNDKQVASFTLQNGNPSPAN